MAIPASMSLNANKEMKGIKATIGRETNAIKRMTRRNERMGMTAPKKKEKEQKKKKVTTALHH